MTHRPFADHSRSARRCAPVAALVAAALALPCHAQASPRTPQVALLSDCPTCPLVRRIGAELRSMSLTVEVHRVASAPTRDQYCGLGKRGVAAGLIVRSGVQPKLFRLSGCDVSLRVLRASDDEHRVVVRAAEALRAEVLSRGFGPMPAPPMSAPPPPTVARVATPSSPYGYRLAVDAGFGFTGQLGSVFGPQANLRAAVHVRLWRWLELEVQFEGAPTSNTASYVGPQTLAQAWIQPMVLTLGLAARHDLFWRFDVRVGVGGGVALVDINGYNNESSYGGLFAAAALVAHADVGLRLIGRWLWLRGGPTFGVISRRVVPDAVFGGEAHWGPTFMSLTASLELRI